MPQLVTTELDTGKTLLEWAVQEYNRHVRGQWWYILIISFGLIFVVYAILSDNFLFALFIILAAIVLYQQSATPAITVPVELTEKGLVLGTRFYPWAELASFSLVYEPPEVKLLYISTARWFLPTIQIPLHDMNPIEVRETLLEFLTENAETPEESVSDTIARRWKLL